MSRRLPHRLAAMYDIVLSAAACARSGTTAHVVWMLEPVVCGEALLLTPGGGRIGRIMEGAFDGMLADEASRMIASGHVVTTTVGPLEAAASGLDMGEAVKFLVVPVDRLPTELWGLLGRRAAVVIDTHVRNGLVTEVEVSEPAESPSVSAQVTMTEARVTTTYAPVTRLVVAGQGPIADALAGLAQTLGWRHVVASRPDLVAGHTAGLSALDAVVIMGHDVEQSSRNLMAALDSDAGYIGALGSRKMQQDRATWMAYRDVTDISRVHGPAGVDIGADTPAEIALSVLAEALGVLKGRLA